jgi:hypothetical protein
MAEKKAVAKKAAAKKPVKKAAAKPAAKAAAKPVAKAAAKKGIKQGDAYKCGVCGLVVSVDETCGCVDTCDIICCDAPMKPKRKAAKK